MKIFYFLSVLAFCFACQTRQAPKENPESWFSEDHLKKNNYASGFEIFEYEDFQLIRVLHPWRTGETLITYGLYKDEKGKKQIPESVDFSVQVPVKSIASLSSTYIGMLALLDSRDLVSAASDPQLICDSVLYSRYLQKDLYDLGNGMKLSAEAVIGHNPDLVMKYIYVDIDPVDEKILASGIPVAYITDFKEEHPLGRAEWIRFVGAFLDKKKEADSIYIQIESDYLKLKQQVELSAYRPSVLTGSSYKGSWYAAGGRSFLATLIADAGGQYHWATDTNSGGIPLSIESVIEHQVEADIWINANASTLDELADIDKRYGIFKAFGTGQVYHYDKRKNPNGGRDYHEGAIVRPDLLLKDMVSILHPEIVGEEYETTYWRKLN